MSINSYQELVTWQKGMDLAAECYVLTKQFPRVEMFGMTSQIRRSASSIPANIAEGWGRGTPAEYLQFLRIAQGSTKELETHLLLSVRVGLSQQEQIAKAAVLVADVSRLLIALIKSVQPEKG